MNFVVGKDYHYGNNPTAAYRYIGSKTNGDPVFEGPNGTVFSTKNADCFKPVPIVVERWGNLYAEFVTFHNSKQAADNDAATPHPTRGPRLGRKMLKLMEGEFDV